MTTSKVTAIIRLPKDQRLATLIAFIHCLEATANDDALDVLGMLLKELFGKAEKENRKSRLRSLKDLDKAALLWADAGEILFDDSLPGNNLRSQIFSRYPREVLEQARKEIKALVQPPDDIYFRELEGHYRSVRSFLPAVLKDLNFESNSKGQALLKAFNWLKFNDPDDQTIQEAPREVIQKPWERYVIREDSSLDFRAYTFCVLKELHTALNRRDVFVPSSWRYTDPRSGLLKGQEWEDTRPLISRTLGFPENPKPILTSLTKELDQTYRAVIARLPNNKAVRFEKIKGKSELILTPLDELEEPKSLTALKEAVDALIPRIDLSELILEISARTGFTDSFTHISERVTRASDLWVSVCAVLMAEACNTGIEAFVREDTPALKKDRLFWVIQNYFRNETLIPANSILVSA